MLERCQAVGFDHKYAPHFDSVEEARIPVLLLANCLLEALANWYLAMKCDEQSFATLERRGVMHKWEEAPRFWLPEYSLPKDGELYRDLARLIDRRNRLSHPKAEIEVDGKPTHKGNHPALSDDEHAFIVSCGTLPRRLVAHLQTFDSEGYVRMMSFMLELKEANTLNRLRRETLRR